MSRSTNATEHFRRTGNLQDSVDLALGRGDVQPLTEDFPTARKQSQEWYAPNQDALNQFVLRLLDKLPESTYSVADFTNGSQGGYKISVSGVFCDHDIASLAAVKGGMMRLDHPPASL